MKLKPLQNEYLLQKLKYLIENNICLFSITLITGDILIGEFFPEWEMMNEDNKEKIWFPRSSMQQPEEFRFGLLITSYLKIVFNSPAGTVYGSANIIDIPFSIIADFKKLEWVNPEINKSGLKNIPNPLATIINKCNTRIAKQNSLKICFYCENALPHENIGDEGITFAADELVYIDIEYFNNSQSSVDVGPMSFGSSIGAYALANTKLQNSILQKTINKIPIGIDKFNTIMGRIQVLQEEQATILEGNDCFIVICKHAESQIPVILKKNSLCYPAEFLNLIRSSLVFYGSIKQIPITVCGEKYTKVFFARAIGFIKKKCINENHNG